MGSLSAQALKLIADSESLPAGGLLLLKAAGASYSQGGRVTFFDGPRILGTAVVNDRSEASFSTARLPAGPHLIYAVTTGDPSGKSNAIAVEIRSKPSGGFGAARAFPAGLAANFVVTADFNGDGHPDLALVEIGRRGLAILLGNGDGTFLPPLPVATSVPLTAIAAGDFNHDGVADLAAADTTGGSIQIFLGKGDGTFSEYGGALPGANTTALTVADYDGDGIADLVAADQPGSSLRIFPGRGDGSFGTPLTVSVGTGPVSLPMEDFKPDGIAGMAVRGVVAADFNGDGLLDVAAADGTGMVSLSLQLPLLGPATHFSVVAPASSVAGFAFPFTVTALDSSNLPAPGYSGTVHFLSSDGQAVLPADANLSGGAGLFSATLKTAGTQTITARDAGNASINGSDSVGVSAAPATARFALTVLAASGTAGVAFSFTVKAQDQFGNTTTGYAGTVHFTSADPAAVLPANATLTNGVGTFSATVKTAGSQRITATDTVTSSITGSDSFFAFPAATTHFAVTAPDAATAGVAFSFTVRALDAFGNSPPGYSGIVHFTSSDPAAVLPSNATLVNGVGTFSATLKTAGAPTLTATDTVTASITGSDIVGVFAAAVTKLSVSAPASVASGSAFIVTVTAQDQFGNTAITGYTGTVHFTSTDPQATLPANAGFFQGSGSFSATLRTAGNQKITATDTVTSSITGTTGNILVAGAPATHFVFLITNSATAGSTLTVEIEAQDQSNATATSYSGTAHLTTTDAAATLPPNVTFAAGIAFFQFTVRTTGTQTVTAVDSASASITGTATFVVTPARATHFTISASLATAGTAFSFSVTAKDQLDNTATAYSGIVHFTSTDPAAVLPANTTLVNGVATFSATLKTAGGQSITATDTVTASITGSGPVSVVAAAATHFGVSAPASVTSDVGFILSVTALDPFNNTTTTYSGTVHFTSTDSQAVLPANSVLSLGIGSFPATLKTAGSQKITATDTINSSITGTTTILVPDASATRIDFFPLSPAIAGATLSTEVVARNQVGDLATSYSGTARLTITDGAATLPANLAFTAGVAILQVTVRTAGTQTITAVDTVNPAITGTTTIVVSAAPAARFAVSAPASAVSGAGFTFTVTAQDQFNNIAKDYAGAVHFTSSDAGAVLPSNSTLASGGGSFAATLRTAGSQKITAADSVNPSITGASGPISVTATAPAISIAAVVNGASFGSGPVAPNTLMTLFGTNPCGSTVQVLVDSRPTDVFFANGTQINFLVPPRIAGQTAAPLQIVCGASASSSFPLQIAGVAPAIFTAVSSGSGQAANVNQDGSVETPAPAGSIVALFTTGFGVLGAPDPDGLSRLLLPVTAFVGETPATVVYAGEAPGFTSGLHQIDVLIPLGAPRGPAVSLRLVVGGVNTQSGVTLAIQ